MNSLVATKWPPSNPESSLPERLCSIWNSASIVVGREPSCRRLLLLRACDRLAATLKSLPPGQIDHFLFLVVIGSLGRIHVHTLASLDGA